MQKEILDRGFSFKFEVSSLFWLTFFFFRPIHSLRDFLCKFVSIPKSKIEGQIFEGISLLKLKVNSNFWSTFLFGPINF